MYKIMNVPKLLRYIFFTEYNYCSSWGMEKNGTTMAYYHISVSGSLWWYQDLTLFCLFFSVFIIWSATTSTNIWNTFRNPVYRPEFFTREEICWNVFWWRLYTFYYSYVLFKEELPPLFIDRLKPEVKPLSMNYSHVGWNHNAC